MKRTLTNLATLAALNAPAQQRTPPQLFGEVTYPQRIASVPLQNRMGMPCTNRTERQGQ